MNELPEWVFRRPAPTLVGSRRSKGGMLIGRQLADRSRQDAGGHGRGKTVVGLRPGMLAGVRVDGAQGACLQSFPAGHVFGGSRLKQFLQIANAIPPVQARANLEHLWGGK